MKNEMNKSIGFFTLLSLLLIALKLCGQIGWSWWYVLMPLYAPGVIVTLLFAIVLTFEWIIRKLHRHGK